MQNFVYHNPTKVAFGKNSIGYLSKLLPKEGKIMLLYGGGSIKKNGVYDQVAKQLEGRDWVEFSGIEANPEYSTLSKAVEQAKSEQVSFLLAVGGGSVIDGVKFVAAAMEYDGDTWDILNGAKVTSAVPLGCVLTLPATGSETNKASVVNRSEMQLKRSFVSEHVRPQFAVLDPEVTYSLPDRQLANGVADAFVHVLEQYLTYPVNAMVQDRFAESIMQNLIDIGPNVFEPTNYEVRANLMWNATQALSDLIGVGVPQDWSTHMIGHELTALYGLDHAVTLAIVLPRLMQTQRKQKHAKLLQFAQRVWGLEISDEESAIDQAIEKTETFFQQLGIKTRLNEYDIDQSAASKVEAQLQKNGFLKFGEQGDITPSKAADIIAASV
ncbi:iron-containing alcohol dehydrogenase [Alteromonadaceae bacterium M269]|nr:iron-containing alcohol dehydrogenase [Alteromonadaceae bacterium M269]